MSQDVIYSDKKENTVPVTVQHAISHLDKKEDIVRGAMKQNIRNVKKNKRSVRKVGRSLRICPLGKRSHNHAAVSGVAIGNFLYESNGIDEEE